VVCSRVNLRQNGVARIDLAQERNHRRTHLWKWTLARNCLTCRTNITRSLPNSTLS